MQQASISIKGRAINVRYMLMLGAVLVLALLNAWRWWPGSSNERMESVKSENKYINIDDLAFAGYVKPYKKDVAVTRNLFEPVVKKPKLKLPRVKKQAVAKPVKKPDKTSVFNLIKLEGILDANDRIQAFLSRQNDVYMVYKGDKFASTIVVDDITHDGILLKDETSGASTWIYLSGD